MREYVHCCEAEQPQAGRPHTQLDEPQATSSALVLSPASIDRVSAGRCKPRGTQKRGFLLVAIGVGHPAPPQAQKPPMSSDTGEQDDTCPRALKFQCLISGGALEQCRRRQQRSNVRMRTAAHPHCSRRPMPSSSCSGGIVTCRPCPAVGEGQRTRNGACVCVRLCKVRT